MNEYSKEKSLKAELLDQDICTFKILLDFDKMLTKETVPIYTFTNSV